MILVKPTFFDSKSIRHLVQIVKRIWLTHKMSFGIADEFHKLVPPLGVEPSCLALQASAE